MRTYSWSQVFHQFYKPTSSFAPQDSGNKISDIIHICRVAGSSTVTVTATYPRMNYCTLYVTAARSWVEKRQRNSSVCLTKTMTASCLGKNLWNSLNATEKLQKVTWPSRKNLPKKNHSSFRVVRFKVLYHNSHTTLAITLVNFAKKDQVVTVSKSQIFISEWLRRYPHDRWWNFKLFQALTQL